jgi:glycosyltransferase involved in cell wall biosynthesis
MKKTLSLIVTTNGNRMLEIDRLFLSIANQSFDNYEIILVLQGFNDYKENEIKSLLLKYNLFYKATLIKSDLISLSKARNIALNYIDGEIVCFPDDDCWFPINFFKQVLDVIKNNQVDVLCTNVFDPIKGLFYGKHRNIKAERVKINQLNSFKYPISVGIFIKTNNLGKLKFNESIGLGTKIGSGEETDLIHNLLALNNSIYFFPKLKVFHEIDNFNILSKIKNYSLGYGYTIALGIKIHKLSFLLLQYCSLKVCLSNTLFIYRFY